MPLPWYQQLAIGAVTLGFMIMVVGTILFGAWLIGRFTYVPPKSRAGSSENEPNHF